MAQRFFYTFIFIFWLIIACRASADVWPTSKTWSEAFEAKYTSWISARFTESFYLKGPWGGISTDCADAIYGARIIFSFENGLPFSLDPGDSHFSNATKNFDEISDPELRVRAFLEFVNSRTWTGSLSRHTYPVAITRESIVPGVIWMKPGHAETVLRVRDTGAIEVRGSWLPSAVRKMITITTLGYIPNKTTQGFRRWIWPQNFVLPPEQQPGYSEAQFENSSPNSSSLEHFRSVSKFEESVRSKLSRKPESAKARLNRTAHDFCALLAARSQVVQLGYDYVSKIDRCLGEKEYDAYSTPNRDANLRRVAVGLGLLQGNDLNKVRAILNSCTSNAIAGTEKIEPYDFFRRMLKLEYSSDPHQTPAARFGLAEAEPTCDTSALGGDQN